MSKQNDRTWRAIRHIYKAAITKDPLVSSGAKMLALLLAEKYADKTSGISWPYNDTLAEDLSVHIRSIQRYINELVDSDWIRKVRIRRRRRGFQVWFPDRPGYDNQRAILYDAFVANDLTIKTHKHDKTVAPYIEPSKEPLKEPEKPTRHQRAFATVVISFDEELPRKEWKAFVEEQTNYPFFELLLFLKTNTGYVFPKRFPETSDQAIESYIAFFDAVHRSEGRCLHG